MNPAPTAVVSRLPLPGLQPAPCAAAALAAGPVAPGSVGASSVTTGQFARQVIRQLLDGAAADTFAAIPLASYGPLAETVRLLREAYAEGKGSATPEQDAGKRGTQAVTTVYKALVRVDEQLTQLMAGDEKGPRKSFKIKELLTANYPPVKFVIPGLIPVGLTILAGRPRKASRGWRSRSPWRPISAPWCSAGKSRGSRCSFWGWRTPNIASPTGSRSCWPACSAGRSPSWRSTATWIS